MSQLVAFLVHSKLFAGDGEDIDAVLAVAFRLDDVNSELQSVCDQVAGILQLRAFSARVRQLSKGVFVNQGRTVAHQEGVKRRPLPAAEAERPPGGVSVLRASIFRLILVVMSLTLALSFTARFCSGQPPWPPQPTSVARGADITWKVKIPGGFLDGESNRYKKSAWPDRPGAGGSSAESKTQNGPTGNFGREPGGRT